MLLKKKKRKNCREEGSNKGRKTRLFGASKTEDSPGVGMRWKKGSRIEVPRKG